MKYSKVGIIDIGSNSIRLVVYEMEVSGAYRTLYENKYSARLGKEVQPDGSISHKAMEPTILALKQFRAICETYQTVYIRAGATAAIRNATNAAEIIGWLQAETGLKIEIISGELEAYYGFLGVVQSTNMTDGIIVDIGGGSTEISLFRNRKLMHSVSLPIGAVNGLAKYKIKKKWSVDQTVAFREEVLKMLDQFNWISKHPNLPLIGLGGTVRTIAKIHQKQIRYSLPIIHHYEMEADVVKQYAERLPYQTSVQRKKIPGLSKERVDLIVPGILILQTVFQAVQASRFIVSGAGLRDGLFREYIAPEQPIEENVLEASVRNLLHFEPPVLEQVRGKVYKDMLQIYQVLNRTEPNPLDKAVMFTSAMMYESGIWINYYKNSMHAVYRILYSSINGLTHRERVLSAIVADYHPEKRTPQMLKKHRDILDSSDVERAYRLGSLLCLVKTLRSTTAVTEVSVKTTADFLLLQLNCNAEPLVEQSKLEDALKHFENAWRVKVKNEILVTSRS